MPGIGGGGWSSFWRGSFLNSDVFGGENADIRGRNILF